MPAVPALCRYIDYFHQTMARIISWFTLFMVLLTLLIVVLRYGFNLGWIAMQESVMYLHGAVFLLGAAYTLQVDQHVRVDVFYHRFRTRGKAWVNLFGSVVLLIPVNTYILIVCWNYVMDSIALREGSPQAGGLPFVFVLKSFLLIFALSMLVQGLAEVLRNLVTLFNRERQ